MKVFENELVLNKVDKVHYIRLVQNHLGRDGLSIYEGLPEPRSTYENGVAWPREYFHSRSGVLAVGLPIQAHLYNP